MNEIGTFLKEKRIERNKTVTDVERETGISNANISRWENGRMIPSIDFCMKLADYYGVTLDALVGRRYCESEGTDINRSVYILQFECLLIYDKLTTSEKNQTIVFMKNFILQCESQTTENSMSRVTDALTTLMIKNKISKAELSRITGIHKTTIGNWYRLGCEPSLDMLVRIADCFNVSTDYLLGREDHSSEINEYGDNITAIQAECLVCFNKLTTEEKYQTLGVMKYFILQRGARV